MAQLVDPTPILPRAFQGNPSVLSLSKYDATLNQALYQSLIKIAQRLNDALMKDGSEAMTAPVVLSSYTVAALPDATAYTGGMIYVSNETGGAVPAFSDGTNWRRVTDRAIVS